VLFMGVCGIALVHADDKGAGGVARIRH
jgi:hypothetical protein